MIDRIDRLEKVQAIKGTLKYGDGRALFKTSGEVAAFEINYNGAIKGIKKLGDGWTIKIGKNKIVIFSMAQSELTELLFTYVGSLTITKCIFVNWNLEKYFANIEKKDTSSWGKTIGQWQSDGRKPEEIIDEKVIKKTIKKSVI